MARRDMELNLEVDKWEMGGVGVSMKQRRRRRQVPIFPPRNLPVTVPDGRVPSLSEDRSAELCIRVPLYQSLNGIGGGEGEGRVQIFQYGRGSTAKRMPTLSLAPPPPSSNPV